MERNFLWRRCQAGSGCRGLGCVERGRWCGWWWGEGELEKPVGEEPIGGMGMGKVERWAGGGGEAASPGGQDLQMLKEKICLPSFKVIF